MAVFERTQIKLPEIVQDGKEKESMFTVTFQRKRKDSGIFIVSHVAPLTRKQLQINAKKYWKNVLLQFKSVKIWKEIRREFMELKEKADREEIVPITRRRSKTWGGSELLHRQKMTKNVLEPKACSEEFRSCFLTSGEVLDGDDEELEEVEGECTEYVTLPEIRMRSNSCGSRPRQMALIKNNAGKIIFKHTITFY